MKITDILNLYLITCAEYQKDLVRKHTESNSDEAALKMKIETEKLKIEWKSTMCHC